MKARVILTVIMAAVILGAGTVALIGCQSEAAEQNAIANRLDAEAALKRAEADRARAAAEAAAERERAKADRLQTEAEAYQRRREAETMAAAERSRIRQTERDASHERVLETLPFVLLIVGVVAIAGLLAVAAAGLLQRRAPDPTLLFLLNRQQRRLAELERDTWHAIATEQRRRLAGGGAPIIIYDAEEGR